MTNLFKQSLFILLFSYSITLGISYNLSDFEQPGLKGDIGIVKVEDKSFAKTTLKPDFNIGALELGLNLNLYFPLNSDDSTPSELANVALRHVAYNHNDWAGFKWGHLSGVTIGQGLLINRYDSGMGGSTEFNSNKAGFLGYADWDTYSVDVLYTGTNVKAARVGVILPYFMLLDTPFELGFTGAEDSDGIDEAINNVAINRNKADGYAVDLTLPVGGDFLTFYTEFAKVNKHGDGATIGLKGNIMDQFSYRLGYINYGKDFIPSYFNSTYELTNTPQGLSKGEQGFVLGAESVLFGGYIKAGAEYEYIGDRNVATASLGWQEVQNTIGIINYTVPFNGSSNAVAKADIAYLSGGTVDYVFHIKRVYYNDKPEDTYSISSRWNLSKLF